MIVVGCGPAGATAARVAAEAGRSVLIIDRKRSVGQPPRCAGFVPGWLPGRSMVDDSSVIQAVDRVVLEAFGHSETIPVNASVIDRTRFDKTLAIQALEAGADLCNGFVIGRSGRTLVARRNGVEADFSATAIVCADGAASVVSRSMARRRRRFLATMQVDVGLDKPADTVLLRRPIVGGRGVGWFIPSDRTARIGVALPRVMSRCLKDAVSGLVREYERSGQIFKNAILGATGGLVPIDRRPLVDAELGLVVAGDARGGLGVDGAGIANAVLSGELAGYTADRYSDSADEDVIGGYADALGRVLNYSLQEGAVGSSRSAFDRWVRKTRRTFEWRPQAPIQATEQGG